MDINEVRCPLCKEHLKVAYIDIGSNVEPTFIMGLTCECSGWIEYEMAKTEEYAQRFGEVYE